MSDCIYDFCLFIVFSGSLKIENNLIEFICFLQRKTIPLRKNLGKLNPGPPTANKNDDSTKMVLGLFKGYSCPIDKEDRDKLKHFDKAHVPLSPFIVLDDSLELWYKTKLLNSVNSFLQGIIASQKHFASGCLQDESGYANISIRLSTFEEM